MIIKLLLDRIVYYEMRKNMNTVLFDLDGTLLPMDVDKFTEAYCSALAGKLAPYGLEPETMIAALWKGTGAMIKNDGTISNEERFWQVFQEELCIKREDYDEIMTDFYLHDFKKLETATQQTESAALCIDILKEKGYRLVIATNPLFPKQATIHRIRFAGLDENDFELFTTYEDYSYCKPNPDYYREIMQKINVRPEDCIMVGNDVQEDGVAALDAGIKPYIINDCLIHRTAEEHPFENGSFIEFIAMINSWPSIK